MVSGIFEYSSTHMSNAPFVGRVKVFACWTISSLKR